MKDERKDILERRRSEDKMTLHSSFITHHSSFIVGFTPHSSLVKKELMIKFSFDKAHLLCQYSIKMGGSYAH